MEKNSPFATSRSTPSTATTSPNRLRRPRGERRAAAPAAPAALVSADVLAKSSAASGRRRSYCLAALARQDYARPARRGGAERGLRQRSSGGPRRAGGPPRPLAPSSRRCPAPRRSAPCRPAPSSRRPRGRRPRPTVGQPPQALIGTPALSVLARRRRRCGACGESGPPERPPRPVGEPRVRDGRCSRRRRRRPRSRTRRTREPRRRRARHRSGGTEGASRRAASRARWRRAESSRKVCVSASTSLPQETLGQLTFSSIAVDDGTKRLEVRGDRARASSSARLTSSAARWPAACGERRSATTSTPGFGSPIALVIERRVRVLGRSAGLAFPSAGREVRVPPTTKPKPSEPSGPRRRHPLSKPAARPIGFAELDSRDRRPERRVRRRRRRSRTRAAEGRADAARPRAPSPEAKAKKSGRPIARYQPIAAPSLPAMPERPNELDRERRADLADACSPLRSSTATSCCPRASAPRVYFDKFRFLADPTC